MVRKVFISYRRDDSRYQARMIYTAFTQVIPREHVFMDIDSIPLGSDFRKILKDWVNECDVLLALIGPGWVSCADPRTAQPRLMNPGDFVRIEIAEALARDIPVVPVLLDGAHMPELAQLPEDLEELVYRHAEFVEFTRFDDDVARLIRKLKPASAKVTQAGTAVPTRDRSAEGRIKVDAGIVEGATNHWFMPGAGKIEWFRDQETGPEMVVVPAGEFMMGSSEDEIEALHKALAPKYEGFFNREGPQHRVIIPRPFAIGRYPVTLREFAYFVDATGYRTDGDAPIVVTSSGNRIDPSASWRSPKFHQDDNHPVVCVNWHDAKAYVAWLSQSSGKHYYLPSEAQWEYAARAGTKSPYWWGIR